MEKKLVTVYFLTSLVAILFCVSGFTMLWGIKSMPKINPPEPQFFCGTISSPVFDNVIFKQRCSACHKPEGTLIGPPLIEIAEKRELEWVHTWLTDREALYRANDSIAIALRDDDYKAICSPHPDLTIEDVAALIEDLKAYE